MQSFFASEDGETLSDNADSDGMCVKIHVCVCSIVCGYMYVYTCIQTNAMRRDTADLDGMHMD